MVKPDLFLHLCTERTGYLISSGWTLKHCLNKMLITHLVSSCQLFSAFLPPRFCIICYHFFKMTESLPSPLLRTNNSSVSQQPHSGVRASVCPFILSEDHEYSQAKKDCLDKNFERTLSQWLQFIALAVLLGGLFVGFFCLVFFFGC